MRILLWAECQKLRRSNILMLNAFAIVFIAVIVLIGGKTTVDGVDFSESSGWYMATTLTWATMFVLPAMTALMGSYMIVTFVLSVLIYLLLFIITLIIEAALHFSALYMEIVLDCLKMYLIQGAGVFFAVSPIIAIVPYIKKSYWAALVLAEIYSFSALFMSMSNPLKNFYPITAVFGVSGYYETSIQELIYCIISLSLCGCLAVVLSAGLNYSQKKRQKNLANINQKTLPF